MCRHTKDTQIINRPIVFQNILGQGRFFINGLMCATIKELGTWLSLINAVIMDESAGAKSVTHSLYRREDWVKNACLKKSLKTWKGMYILYTNNVLAILHFQVLEAPFQEMKRRSLEKTNWVRTQNTNLKLYKCKLYKCNFKAFIEKINK